MWTKITMAFDSENNKFKTLKEAANEFERRADVVESSLKTYIKMGDKFLDEITQKRVEFEYYRQMADWLHELETLKAASLEAKGFDSFAASEKFNKCKDGDVFELNGHDMMRITGMMMQDLKTNDYYMKGIDFE